MKAFLRKHKKLHIWLLADILLLAAYFLFRGNRMWMNALANGFTTPLKRAIGRLTYLTDISVMELVYAAAALFGLVYVVWSVVSLIRRREARWNRAYHALLWLVDAALAVYAIFCLLWGINFWTDSFQDQSGIYAQPVAQEDLTAVTAYFVRQLTDTADTVPRDGNGLFSETKETILENSVHIYSAAEKEFPCLAFEDPGVKAMAFSRLMSIIGYTGVYCPFTGESNLNVDSPACMLPSTVAHELAHQRGIASEQECNFLAVLASTTSGDAVYAYSGWLMGFIHLGNALYRVDPDTYWALRDTLPEPVKADLAENNAYWGQFQDNVAQKVSDKVYDTVLKAYGDEDGIQSYGTVVDMLVAYYKEIA